MTPVSFWQYFDYISLAALLVVVSTLVISQAKATKSLPSTISRSVAASPRSSLIFSITMTIFFPLYYAFLWFWVGPRIFAPYIFYILLACAFIAELVFVWAPASEKNRGIHTISASFVGLIMLILSVVIFMTGHNLHEVATVSIVIFWIVTLITSMSLMKIFRKYTFIAEVAFCVAFLIMTSIIAHI